MAINFAAVMVRSIVQPRTAKEGEDVITTTGRAKSMRAQGLQWHEAALDIPSLQLEPAFR
jgi:hypothetical protein